MEEPRNTGDDGTAPPSSSDGADLEGQLAAVQLLVYASWAECAETCQVVREREDARAQRDEDAERRVSVLRASLSSLAVEDERARMEAMAARDAATGDEDDVAKLLWILEERHRERMAEITSFVEECRSIHHVPHTREEE